MLSAKIKRIIVVFAIVLVIGLALILGFNLGLGFIVNQNDRALAIESMEMAKLKSKAEEESEPTVTDEHGNSYKVTPTPVPESESKFKMPRHVKKDTPGAVEIYIQRGQDSKDIAETLKHKGIIDKTLPFIVMAELNGFDGRYQQGTHFVLKGMDYNEIMYNLALPPETTWITFPEGFTYLDIKNALRENGVNIDEEEMDRLMNTPSAFTDFSFVTNIPTNVPGRVYALEGYLFPDTYQFDLNVDEEDIIRIFLRNTENKITREILDRAAAIDMPIDDVLTLASIIQNEAGSISEMYKVSRVFYNRMHNEDLLQSCATTNYIRELKGQPKVWAATEADIALNNRYNTYKFAGLTPGPIGNPGLEAIRSALYPDDENKKLYYFCAKGDGTNAFASTLAEHEKNIELYSQNWKTPRDQ